MQWKILSAPLSSRFPLSSLPRILPKILQLEGLGKICQMATRPETETLASSYVNVATVLAFTAKILKFLVLVFNFLPGVMAPALVRVVFLINRWRSV